VTEVNRSACADTHTLSVTACLNDVDPAVSVIASEMCFQPHWELMVRKAKTIFC